MPHKRSCGPIYTKSMTRKLNTKSGTHMAPSLNGIRKVAESVRRLETTIWKARIVILLFLLYAEPITVKGGMIPVRSLTLTQESVTGTDTASLMITVSVMMGITERLVSTI